MRSRCISACAIRASLGRHYEGLRVLPHPGVAVDRLTSQRSASKAAQSCTGARCVRATPPTATRWPRPPGGVCNVLLQSAAAGKGGTCTRAIARRLCSRPRPCRSNRCDHTTEGRHGGSQCMCTHERCSCALARSDTNTLESWPQALSCCATRGSVRTRDSPPACQARCAHWRRRCRLVTRLRSAFVSGTAGGRRHSAAFRALQRRGRERPHAWGAL